MRDNGGAGKRENNSTSKRRQHTWKYRRDAGHTAPALTVAIGLLDGLYKSSSAATSTKP